MKDKVKRIQRQLAGGVCSTCFPPGGGRVEIREITAAEAAADPPDHRPPPVCRECGMYPPVSLVEVVVAGEEVTS